MSVPSRPVAVLGYISFIVLAATVFAYMGFIHHDHTSIGALVCFAAAALYGAGGTYLGRVVFARGS
jgi:hypothetical protein